MIIEKNTICYTSEVGHNNFWYPTSDRVIIKENCKAQRLTWIGGGDKIAIKILKNNLFPLSLTENATCNTSPPQKNEYTVVWIKKPCSRN
tara:strand:- start:294 stop:563 length:270 start_codon:yes stop_codon:yes gene_type:complete